MAIKDEPSIGLYLRLPLPLFHGSRSLPLPGPFSHASLETPQNFPIPRLQTASATFVTNTLPPTRQFFKPLASPVTVAQHVKPKAPQRPGVVAFSRLAWWLWRSANTFDSFELFLLADGEKKITETPFTSTNLTTLLLRAGGSVG